MLPAISKVTLLKVSSQALDSLYGSISDILFRVLNIPFPAGLAGCMACLGRVDEAEHLVECAFERARALDEDADLWTGRVRLKWAHGLRGAGRSKEARDEARAARDILCSVLGPEAALTREAADLLKDLGDAD